MLNDGGYELGKGPFGWDYMISKEKAYQELAKIEHFSDWAIWNKFMAVPKKQKKKWRIKKYTDWADDKKAVKIRLNNFEIIASFLFEGTEYKISSTTDWEKDPSKLGKWDITDYNKDAQDLSQLVEAKAIENLKEKDKLELDTAEQNYQEALKSAEGLQKDGEGSFEERMLKSMEYVSAAKKRLELAEKQYNESGIMERHKDYIRVKEEMFNLLQFTKYQIVLPKDAFTIQCLETGIEDAEKVQQQIVEHFKLPSTDYVEIKIVTEIPECPYHPKKERDEFIRPPTKA